MPISTANYISKRRFTTSEIEQYHIYPFCPICAAPTMLVDFGNDKEAIICTSKCNNTYISGSDNLEYAVRAWNNFVYKQLFKQRLISQSIIIFLLLLACLLCAFYALWFIVAIGIVVIVGILLKIFCFDTPSIKREMDKTIEEFVSYIYFVAQEDNR